MGKAPDFSGLSGLQHAPSAKEWAPPTLESFGFGDVLSFDQSLTAAGWVRLASYAEGLGVIASGVEKGGMDHLRGHEQNLSRGVVLYDRFGEVVQNNTTASTLIVHETPPVGGGKMARPEASLLAALALRIAVFDEGLDVEMLGAQPAKKMICGNANADKKTAHAALALHLAPLILGYDEHITNEAKRDALLIALLRLTKEKR